jgi:hypothetical protein
MSNQVIDFTEDQLRRVFIQIGLRAEDVEKALKDYTRYRESELTSLSLLSYRELMAIGTEAVKGQIKLNGIEIAEDIVRDYLRYVNYKKDIAESYQNSRDWNIVLTTVVYSDIDESNESFIDYVEETYQTKVKDATHLKKLCNINTDKDGAGATLNELEDIITTSRLTKYNRALETALNKGAMYKDLLQIKPTDYGLPETWSRYLSSDQYTAIIWAINEFFMIGGFYNTTSPELRVIAKEIEAPYSVLLDAHKLTA